MANPIQDFTEGLDEFGLETPFAESPQAEREFVAELPLNEFGESPFAEDLQEGSSAGLETASEELGSQAEVFETPVGEAEGYEPEYTENVNWVESQTEDGQRTQAGITAEAEFLSGSLQPQPAIFTRRLVVSKHPLIRAHRGSSPDLILRWNEIGASGSVDVVLHFHGYSGRREAMRIDRDKEAHSGLDFSDPKLDTAGRRYPTIGVLPRGNYFGGRSGAGYNFPALMRPGAVRVLVRNAIERMSLEIGHTLTMGRLILTAHSGGGAPLAAVLGDANPDEVHIFDGTYGSGVAIAGWARRRIAREVAEPSGSPPALRILFRPGTQTQAQAKAIWQQVCSALHEHSASHLRGRFRVEATTVGHNDIPSRFGWRLLADAQSDLPDASPLPCPHRAVRETLEASPHSFDTAQTHEQITQDALEISPETQWEGYEDFATEEDYVVAEESEDLAWLDLEADETSQDEWNEDEAFELSEEQGPIGEGFEPADEHAGFEIAAMEQLIDAEIPGPGFVDRIKGITAFVLGPTLRMGSVGRGVQTLQRCLTQLGHAVQVDGHFGVATQRAVFAFQSGAGLTVDGVCGPRTKSAIAAALGAKPGPQPVPSLTQGTTPTLMLSDAIVRVAETEYRRWNDGRKLRETDTDAVPILQRYYREGVNIQVGAAELQDTNWQKEHPWSAVFISYVMRAAGAGSAFRYSPAHQDYIAAGRRNRLDNVTSNPFWAYRADEMVPQVGDLICNARGDSGATYDNIGDKQRRKTHCDIVTAVSPGQLRVIGGNVNQNVDVKHLETRQDGRLALTGKQAAIFAVLRCRGVAGARTPVPPSQPATPAPLQVPAATDGVKEAFLQSIASVKFARADDINAFFLTRTNLHFIDWFNRTLAGRGDWRDRKIAAKGVTQHELEQRFNHFWDYISIIFNSQIGLIQFVTLMSIAINEVNGNMYWVSELSGRGLPGHPGLAYIFDKIPGTKNSYNLRPNMTAFECFRNDDFIQAHGHLGMGDKLANTTDEVWGGTTFPQDKVRTIEELSVNGFIMQADFYKFRGRGVIQITWRNAYINLVRYIQDFTGSNITIKKYREIWKGLNPELVATRSTNAQWDELFADLEFACHAIRVFSKSKGDFLSIAKTAGELNGRGPGSIYNVGLMMNGGQYASLFRRRVIQILNALGN